MSEVARPPLCAEGLVLAIAEDPLLTEDYSFTSLAQLSDALLADSIKPLFRRIARTQLLLESLPDRVWRTAEGPIV